jgi:putative addiction module component (TIGR02574 family)
MNEVVDKLKEELAVLPVADRAALASFLLSSLDDEEDDPAEVEAAWDAELAQRMEEMQSGKVVGIPAAEVLEEMRRKYP